MNLNDFNIYITAPDIIANNISFVPVKSNSDSFKTKEPPK